MCGKAKRKRDDAKYKRPMLQVIRFIHNQSQVYMHARQDGVWFAHLVCMHASVMCSQLHKAKPYLPNKVTQCLKGSLTEAFLTKGIRRWHVIRGIWYSCDEINWPKKESGSFNSPWLLQRNVSRQIHASLLLWLATARRHGM